jgi:hypothetical protein
VRWARSGRPCAHRRTSRSRASSLWELPSGSHQGFLAWEADREPGREPAREACLARSSRPRPRREDPMMPTVIEQLEGEWRQLAVDRRAARRLQAAFADAGGASTQRELEQYVREASAADADQVLVALVGPASAGCQLEARVLLQLLLPGVRRLAHRWWALGGSRRTGGRSRCCGVAPDLQLPPRSAAQQGGSEHPHGAPVTCGSRRSRLAYVPFGRPRTGGPACAAWN